MNEPYLLNFDYIFAYNQMLNFVLYISLFNLSFGSLGKSVPISRSASADVTHE